MECVLLTGGTGFIGSRALDQLAVSGREVHFAGRNCPATLPSGVSFHACDLLDPSQPSRLLETVRPTHLLHFAWVTEPKVYWTSLANLDWFAATLGLARAFAGNGGRRLVVAGTCAEYSWSEHTLTEGRTPLDPATPYGRAKAALYETLAAFAPQLGLSFAWGRIFFPFGPGEKPGKLLSDTVTSLLGRQPVALTDGRQSWDFMHVDDVAAAFIALLFSEVEGAVNIASGVARTVRSVVEDFADRLGGRELLDFGARPRGAAESPYMAAAVERLGAEVGFAPRLSWDAAVDDTIQRWRVTPPAGG